MYPTQAECLSRFGIKGIDINNDTTVIHTDRGSIEVKTTNPYQNSYTTVMYAFHQWLSGGMLETVFGFLDQTKLEFLKTIMPDQYPSDLGRPLVCHKIHPDHA